MKLLQYKCKNETIVASFFASVWYLLLVLVVPFCCCWAIASFLWYTNASVPVLLNFLQLFAFIFMRQTRMKGQIVYELYENACTFIWQLCVWMRKKGLNYDHGYYRSYYSIPLILKLFQSIWNTCFAYTMWRLFQLHSKVVRYWLSNQW